MTKLTLLIATLVLVSLLLVVPAMAGNTAAQADMENIGLYCANLG